MSKLSAIILCIIIGFSLGLQPPINTGLGKVITSKLAVWHSLFTSALFMTIYILFTSGFGPYKAIVKISPLYWIGGILGILIVFFAVLTLPVLGTGLSFTIFIAVQLLVAIVIDHFGLLGMAKNPINIYKIIGMLLMILGVGFVMKS